MTATALAAIAWMLSSCWAASHDTPSSCETKEELLGETWYTLMVVPPAVRLFLLATLPGEGLEYWRVRALLGRHAAMLEGHEGTAEQLLESLPTSVMRSRVQLILHLDRVLATNLDEVHRRYVRLLVRTFERSASAAFHLQRLLSHPTGSLPPLYSTAFGADLLDKPINPIVLTVLMQSNMLHFAMAVGGDFGHKVKRWLLLHVQTNFAFLVGGAFEQEVLPCHQALWYILFKLAISRCNRTQS